jgi:ketosteroid isomerase-like protein
MKRADFETWIQGYIKAWTSNDPADIAALFTEDAVYYRLAFTEPWIGREAILKGWDEHKDQPSEWEFEYDWLAIEGETGVLRGLSTYGQSVYSNIWLIKLDEKGRCYEFREWWVKKG